MPSRRLAGGPNPAVAGDLKVLHHGPFMLPFVAFVIAIAVVSTAVVIAVVVVMYRRCMRSHASLPPAVVDTAASAAAEGEDRAEDSKPSASLLRQFTYAELRRSTGGFSPSHRLGQGGFGPVFRGSLSGSGKEVAVKIMDSGSLQGEREFQNELSLSETILGYQSPDRNCVVAPIGFCVADRKRRLSWRWGKKRSGDGDSNDEDTGVGKRMLLVYDLMQNGSLQDGLLDRRCPELVNWTCRFSVVVDIALGLQFLHTVCDPPIIHGDIKPSNILLDARLSARIADLGLARVKSALMTKEGSPSSENPPDEEESVVEVHLENDNEKKKEQFPPSDNASVMGDTVSDSATTFFDDAIVIPKPLKSLEDDGSVKHPEAEETAASVGESIAALEVASTSDTTGFDKTSMDGGRDSRNSGSRRRNSCVLPNKDWWWRQDSVNGANSETGSSSSVKDYVLEWIRSEIKKERPPAITAEDRLPKLPAKYDRKKRNQRKLEWWASLDEERLKKERKNRPAREWWREEFCEELTNKHRRRALLKCSSTTENRVCHLWSNDENPLSLERRIMGRSWSRGTLASMDGTKPETITAQARNIQDHIGIDIPKSAAVSSTPSMRGTVCYVAPEYGGGGPLSEKCDIYSFGVLLLVVVSGRRPLQVTASPMSEFERANLISWARQLSHRGRLLELVDPSLQDVDREQALLCITVALLCIQRSPACRPSIKEIVAMLTGQTEPPNLPLEFSPSPPSLRSRKSKKNTLEVPTSLDK